MAARKKTETPKAAEKQQDKLILRKRPVDRIGGSQVIRVPLNVYVLLSEISEKTNMRMGEVVEKILDFAADRIEIVG